MATDNKRVRITSVKGTERMGLGWGEFVIWAFSGPLKVILRTNEKLNVNLFPLGYFSPVLFISFLES